MGVAIHQSIHPSNNQKTSAQPSRPQTPSRSPNREQKNARSATKRRKKGVPSVAVVQHIHVGTFVVLTHEDVLDSKDALQRYLLQNFRLHACGEHVVFFWHKLIGRMLYGHVRRACNNMKEGWTKVKGLSSLVLLVIQRVEKQRLGVDLLHLLEETFPSGNS